MGKNFSTNNVSKNRKASDFYETPYSLTSLLLDKVTLSEPILEPACGNGAISRVLREKGYSKITEYDKEVDFLSVTYADEKTIITNPPYSKALGFIVQTHGLKSVQDAFFLLPLSYLHGKARHDTIYHNTPMPLFSVYVFTRYPLLGGELREDGKHKTGMMVYAWFHFKRTRENVKPSIDWLDNNSYILSKKDTA